VDAYLAGMLLGLAMITPIGPQNIFLINQGFTFGVPRVFVAVVAAGVCDTVLISLGGAGTSAVLESVPGIEEALLAAGVVFLTWLAVRSFRSRPEDFEDSPPPEMRWQRVVAQCASVTVLNPHAVLDVVGILGVAIAAQDPAHRPVFAAGTVSLLALVHPARARRLHAEALADAAPPGVDRPRLRSADAALRASVRR
jgi:L-lysine exporter family protein LysE/ArgO